MVDNKKESLKEEMIKIKRQFTDPQRQKLLKQYLDYCAEGKDTKQAAKLVGVAYMTLHTWKKRFKLPNITKKSTSKVSVAQVPRGKIVIYFPNGCRADCQTVEDAAQLLSLLL